MELSCHIERNFLVIDFPGEELTKNEAHLFEQESFELLLAHKMSDTVLNLGELKFIDCSGLAALFAFGSKVRTRGGNLKIVNTAPSARLLFHTVRLEAQFEIYHSVAEAVTSFSLPT